MPIDPSTIIWDDAKPDPSKIIWDAPASPQASSVPTNSNLDSIINDAAQKNGLDPRLIRSVVGVESAGNATAVSPKGARGLMQLMPDTAKELGVTDPNDPAQNINAGARYLRQQLDAHNGNLDKALAAYNWGPGNLAKYGLDKAPAETVNYLQKVKAGIGDVPLVNAPGQPQTPASQVPPDNAVERFLRENLSPTAQEALLGAGRAAAGLGQGLFNDVPNAIDQVLGAVIPDSLQQILNGGQTLGDQVAQKEQQYQQTRQEMGGGGSFDPGRLAGDILNPAALATGASPAGVAGLNPSAVQAVLQGVKAGAAGAVLQPIDTSSGESVLVQKGAQALVGGTLGGAIGGVANLVSSAIGKAIGASGGEAPQATKDVLQASQQQGIPLAAGDILSSNKMLQNITGLMENTRLPGASLSQFRVNQQESARAAAERMVNAQFNALKNTPIRREDLLRSTAQGSGPHAAEAKQLVAMIDNAGGDARRIMQYSGKWKWLRMKLDEAHLYAKRDLLAEGKVVDPSNTVAAIDNTIEKLSGDVNTNRPAINTLMNWRNNLTNPTNVGFEDPSQIALGQFSDELVQNNLVNDFGRMKRFQSVIEDLKQGSQQNGVMDSAKLYLNDILKGVKADIGSVIESDPALKAAQARADTFHKLNVVPFQAKNLAKALNESSPKEIWGAFVRNGGDKGDYAAQQFYRALDDKGRAAVRAGIVERAYSKANSALGFDPIEFKNSIEKTAFDTYFTGVNKSELNGLLNLYGHLQKVSPSHLIRYNAMIGGGKNALGYIGLGAAGAAGGIPTAAGLYGTAGLMRWLLTSKTGKSILLSSNALAKGGSQEAKGRMLDKLFNRFASAGGTGIGSVIGVQGNAPIGDQNGN